MVEELAMRVMERFIGGFVSEEDADIHELDVFWLCGRGVCLREDAVDLLDYGRIDFPYLFDSLMRWFSLITLD